MQLLSLLIENCFSRKLELYGVSKDTLKIHPSGSEDGSMLKLEEINPKCKVDIGCFQGSIGAPLLFIIYVNDLVMLQDENTKVSIYAVDNNYQLRLKNDEEI